MKHRSCFLFGIFICTFAYAQTETTKWYIEGKLYETTTCESGGDITMPTTPERFGYTFDGWTPAIYDMSTLDKTINGSTSTNNNVAKTWNVTFSYGRVYGKALCSPTGGDPLSQNEGIDTTSSGRYCYCRLTDFVPTGSTITYEPVASRWLFRRDHESASNCASGCTSACASNVMSNGESMRTRLFMLVAN